MKANKILFGLLLLALCASVWGVDPRSSVKAVERQIKPQTYQTLPPSRDDILNEDFNGMQFPPAGWSSYDIDGGSRQWQRNTNGYHSAPACAIHLEGAWEAGMQEGWLVTPALNIAQGEEYVLSFWNYSAYPEDGYWHKVLINTSSGDPAAPGWVTLWAQTYPETTEDWSLWNIPLTGYHGSNVHIAFQYTGEWADAWLVDDVKVTADLKYLTLLPPQGLGSYIPAEGTHAYPTDTHIGITATPGFGQTWDSWVQGPVENSANSRTMVYMDDDHSVQAAFTPYELDNLVNHHGIGMEAFTSVKAGGTNREVAENFSSRVDAINKVVIHGVTLRYEYFGDEGEGQWVEWDPGNTQPFIVRFYNQSPNTQPNWNSPYRGPWNVTGKMFSTGTMENWTQDYIAWKVELDLPQSVNLDSGWVSVQMDRDGGAGGYFLWLTSESGSGNGVFYQRGEEEPEMEGDLMLELWGQGESGTLRAPVLKYPVNQTGLPKPGFDFQWRVANTGALPEYYILHLYEEQNLYPNDPSYSWEVFDVNNFDPTKDPQLSDRVSYGFGERWFWAVEAVRGTSHAMSSVSYFETQNLINIPHEEDFGSGEDAEWPLDWTQTHTGGILTNRWKVFESNDAGGLPHEIRSTAINRNGDARLISPPINTSGIGTFTVQFKHFWDDWSPGMTAKVQYSHDLETWHDSDWSLESGSGHDLGTRLANIPCNGQPVTYVAWLTEGYHFCYSFWFLDDIKFYENPVDLVPPTISDHLPPLSTVRNDISFPITVDVADDDWWNSPLGGVELHWSNNGGSSWNTPIVMTRGEGDSYTGIIPPQDHGSQVVYRIKAWDIHNNLTQTQDYSFQVNDPVWISYSYGVGTTIMGVEEIDWAPMIGFNNPLFGTGIPLQLLAVDGMAVDLYGEVGSPALISVYTWDGGEYMYSLFEPFEYYFPSGQHQVIPLAEHGIEDLLITTPTFFVIIDLPAGHYFLWNEAFDYGTSYFWFGDELYGREGGNWCIGALAQIGGEPPVGLMAPQVSVAYDDGYVSLTWPAVPNAQAYNIYGSNDAYDEGSWYILDTVNSPGFTYLQGDARKFFRVTASDQENGSKAAFKPYAPVSSKQAPSLKSVTLPQK